MTKTPGPVRSNAVLTEQGEAVDGHTYETGRKPRLSANTLIMPRPTPTGATRNCSHHTHFRHGRLSEQQTPHSPFSTQPNGDTPDGTTGCKVAVITGGSSGNRVGDCTEVRPTQAARVFSWGAEAARWNKALKR